MKKFVLLYHATPEAEKMIASASPKQQAKAMEGWMKWGQKCGDAIVDMGNPLVGGLTVGKEGIYKKSRKNVGGYSIMQAISVEALKKLLKGHPHLKSHPSSTLEVHEVMSIPGM